jgi:ribosome-binding protein aMBF1 (putative translation factor)
MADNFGDMIRLARTKKGWRVADLRKNFNNEISLSYITQVEKHGEIPSRELICRLARVLELDLPQMLELAKQGKLKQFSKSLEAKYSL